MRGDHNRDTDRKSWRERIFDRLLGEDASWVLGDLEERSRKRRGPERYWCLIRDVASLLGWALLRRPASSGEGMMGSGGTRWLFDSLRQDLVFTRTTLRRDLGFTIAVVLTLGIGIGADTATFSVVQSVLLRPLPYADPDRLVMLWTSIPSRDIDEGTSAYGNVRDWRDQNHVFEELATFDPTTRTLTGGEYPESIMTADVSANLFSLLGVEPLVGRTFSEQEERARAPLAVLSHDLWARRFSSSPVAIGQTIEVNGMPFEVVGVMPEGFGFPERSVALWLPQTVLSDWDGRATRRGSDSWRVLGRLAPDASLQSARRDMAELADRLEQEHPEENAGLGINVVQLERQLTGYSLRVTLWTLYGAVSLVLLIACANAAHLIVARRTRRAHELALRTALGATRGRLIRLALTETVVISLFAAGAGLLLATVGLDVLLSLVPAGLPRLDGTRINLPVLAYGVALALSSGVAAGTWPGSNHSSVYHALRQGRRSGYGTNGHRARQLLVVAQFALAITLVFGCNLLVRSFARARAVDLGFDASNVLIANLRVESDSDRRAVYREVVDHVGALPGVTAASVDENLFISGAPNRAITVEGSRTAEPAFENLRIDAIAGPFFHTLGVPLREGRELSAEDGGGSPPVAIINETMARHLWPGESPVGKRFRTGSSEWIRVVGVVGDMRRQGFERAPIAQAFLPYAQAPSRSMNLLVRTDGPVPGLPAAIRRTVFQIDRSVPLYGITTVEETLDTYLVQRRFQMALLGLFSVIALVLAAVGIYGLVQYSVTQRTREVGIRVAVGARSAQVVSMMARQGLALAILGLAAGVVLASLLSRAISPLLFGVSPADPTSIVVTSLLLLVTAVMACYLPARRAAHIDPAIALRDSSSSR